MANATYETRFMEIGPPVPENIFEGVLPYMSVVHIMSSNFHFLVPESFHTKFSSEVHSSLGLKKS